MHCASPWRAEPAGLGADNGHDADDINESAAAYASTSYVFGDKKAGYSTSDERIIGVNFFPFNTRNVKVNGQLIFIDGSPVNSVFGYYVGGQKGQTFSMDFSVLF